MMYPSMYEPSPDSADVGEKVSSFDRSSGEGKNLACLWMRSPHGTKFGWKHLDRPERRSRTSSGWRQELLVPAVIRVRQGIARFQLSHRTWTALSGSAALALISMEGICVEVTISDQAKSLHRTLKSNAKQSHLDLIVTLCDVSHLCDEARVMPDDSLSACSYPSRSRPVPQIA